MKAYSKLLRCLFGERTFIADAFGKTKCNAGDIRLFGGGNRDDETGIDSSAKERRERDIAHQLRYYSCFEQVAKLLDRIFFLNRISIRFRKGPVLRLPCLATFPDKHMTWQELLNPAIGTSFSSRIAIGNRICERERIEFGSKMVKGAECTWLGGQSQALRTVP